MAGWRRVVCGVLFSAIVLIACSSEDGTDDAADPAAGESAGSAERTTTTGQDPAAPASVETTPVSTVTEEEVTEGRSGYDAEDASVGISMEIIDPDGVIKRAEAFIPDRFPEDRAVIDSLIEGETAVTYDFFGYEAVLLYEPLPHCGKIPALSVSQEAGQLLLAIELDKSGECSEIAFTAAVGVDFNDGFSELPITASNN